MDIDRFVEERKDRWRRLEEVLGKAENSTEQELGPEGMRELLRLYRLTSSDLNQARSLTADPELLERLNALAGRGYRFIYRSRRQGGTDRKSTRLNSSHLVISYAVFCVKKKKK